MSEDIEKILNTLKQLKENSNAPFNEKDENTEKIRELENENNSQQKRSKYDTSKNQFLENIRFIHIQNFSFLILESIMFIPFILNERQIDSFNYLLLIIMGISTSILWLLINVYSKSFLSEDKILDLYIEEIKDFLYIFQNSIAAKKSSFLFRIILSSIFIAAWSASGINFYFIKKCNVTTGRGKASEYHQEYSDNGKSPNISQTILIEQK